MGIRQRAARWLIRLEAWLTPKLPTVAGGRSDADRPVPSTELLQPLMLPGYMQRSFKTAEEQTTYLQESSRAAYQFGFDMPFIKDAPFMPPSEDPLKEWDFATREYVLSQCHAAYARHPLANAAVEYTADFVIGEGFNVAFKSPEVKTFLEAFIANPDNNIREYERQAIIDLQVDGELILRYFKGKSEDGTAGQIAVMPLKPWELWWIETELGNFRRPIEYRFQRYQTRGDAPLPQLTKIEDIPADEILHVAVNRHAYELRGRPDLYRILPWLRADTEFQQNRARQNYWRGALLWLVSVGGGANAQQVASVVNRWSKPPTPGSVAVESENVTVQAATNPVGAGDAHEDGRQLKLRSIFGMRMPEYMFADGHNNNLASATAQQLPAVTRFAAYQTVMIERLWYPLFHKAIQTGIDAGLVSAMVPEVDTAGNLVFEHEDLDLPVADVTDPTQPNPILANPDVLVPKQQKAKMIPATEAFDVSYAPIQDTDFLKLMQGLSLAEGQEWVSKQGAQERAGFDPAIENERMKNEQLQDLKAMAQGTKPVPPQMIPQPPPPASPGQEGQPPASK